MYFTQCIYHTDSRKLSHLLFAVIDCISFVCYFHQLQSAAFTPFAGYSPFIFIIQTNSCMQNKVSVKIFPDKIFHSLMRSLHRCFLISLWFVFDVYLRRQAFITRLFNERVNGESVCMFLLRVFLFRNKIFIQFVSFVSRAIIVLELYVVLFFAMESSATWYKL